MMRFPYLYEFPRRSLAWLPIATFFLFFTWAFPLNLQAKDKEGAEIKLLVTPAGTDEAMKTLGLAAKTPKNYRIYFVDTTDLRLHKNGVILRLRDKGKKEPETETTVKFRPEDQSKDPDLELAKKPVKETEWLIGKGQNLSYSLKREIGGTELLENPGQNLAKLFSSEQKAFYKLITKEEFNPAKLKVLGPIVAKIWEWKEPGVQDDVSAELWKLGEEQIFELSRKCKPDKLEKKADDFEKAFKEKGIAASADPESKTRKAIEYYSKHEE